MLDLLFITDSKKMSKVNRLILKKYFINQLK